MTQGAKRKQHSGAIVAAAAVAFATFASVPAAAQTTQCIVNVSAQGTPDAITSSRLPCGTTANLVVLTAAGTNITATPTYAPLGSSPLPIIRANGAAVVPGDILPGYVALLSSTGTSWVLLNPATGIDLSNVGILNVANVWTAVNSYSATATPVTMFPGSFVMGGILASPPTFNGNGEGSGYLSATNGAVLQGQGSIRDFSVLNNAGAVALSIATGTTNVAVAGSLTSTGTTNAALSAGSFVVGGILASAPTFNANGEGAAYLSATSGVVMQGRGSARDFTVLNNVGAVALSVATGTTNVTAAGTLTTSATTNTALSAGSLVLGGILAIAPTFNANGEGVMYLSATNGAVVEGQGSTRDFTVLNNNGAVALSVATNTADVTAAGSMTANYFLTPSNTITLSGTTVPTNTTAFRYNLAGTSTNSGNTWGSTVRIGGSSDNANLTVGGWPELLIAKNYGGNVFAGNRFGLVVQMILNTPSVLANVGDGMVGESVKMVANVNSGGVSTGYGVSNFGIGSIFGTNPWCQLLAGATYYYECTGMEINASINAGANASIFSVLQLIMTSDHGVHGAVSDKILKMGAQVGASVGVRDAMTIGDYQSQWPVDPNGYLMTVESGGNVGTVPTVAAGGIDLRQAAFSGVGRVGGGFAFRSDGMQISAAGQVQPGYGLVDGSSGGLTISVPQQKLTGAAVAAGGTGFTTGDLVSDTYGGVYAVTAAAGVVTGVAIKNAGWNASPPGNPVSTTALTRVGSGFGSGLTLNLTWAGQSTLNLRANGSGTVALGSGTDVVKLPVVTTGTPAASLCLDASGIIIKKTTAGSCI